MNDFLARASSILSGLTSDDRELLSQETLLRFLDRQNNLVFDRNIFDQLYQRMPKGRNGYITLGDFKKVMVEALQTLRQKIRSTESEMSQRQSELMQLSQRLEQLQQSERYNNYNISQSSKLYVMIHEAEILFPGSTPLVCVVGYDNVKRQTKVVPRNSPVWEQKLELPISSGNEEVHIIIIDEELAEKQEIGGQIKLRLDPLKDQKVHEVTLDLRDVHDVVLLSKLRVSLQWIHSESKKCEQDIVEIQQELQQLKFDLGEYKEDAEAIVYPFLSAGDIEQKQAETEQHQQILASITYRQAEGEINRNQWLKLSLAFTLLYLLAALCCSLMRCVYLDLLIIFYSLWFYVNNYELRSLLHIKIIWLLLFVALLYDIAWLIIYTSPWVQNSTLAFHLEGQLHVYEIVLSYVILGNKVILLLFHCKTFQAFPEKRQDIYDEQYYRCFNQQHLSTRQQPPPPPQLQANPSEQLKPTYSSTPQSSFQGRAPLPYQSASPFQAPQNALHQNYYFQTRHL